MPCNSTARSLAQLEHPLAALKVASGIGNLYVKEVIHFGVLEYGC